MADEWDQFPAPAAPAPKDEWDQFPAPVALQNQNVGQREPDEWDRIPEAFLDRVVAGQNLEKMPFNRLAQARRAKEAFAEGFGDRPLGFTPEVVQQLQDAGIYRDPATGRGGALRFMTEAVAQPTAALVDAGMRTVSGLVHFAGEVGQQTAEDIGLTTPGANQVRNEIKSYLEYEMTRGDQLSIGRPHIDQEGARINDQAIGPLPRKEDFQTAAKVLDSPAAEKNLRDLWEEKGLHPAEVVHDVQGDAFLKDQVTWPWTNPGYENMAPTKIPPVTNSPMPEGTPRSELAKTGEPHVDDVLANPVLQRVIDNAVIDDAHEIPNSWGGSVPLENPTTYRDKDFPKTLTVDGVTFDTAEPAAIHENIEAFVIEKLMAAGMAREPALRAAYWGWGNPAEHAWYRAHGMDPDHVEAVLKPFLDAIASRKARAKNIPDDLFRQTYPDGDPLKDVAGEIEKPSAAEIARAKEILSSDRREPSAGPQLVVARRMPDGSLKIGKPDQIHTDLMTKKELADNAPPIPEEQMGYATRDGRFLSRQEALEWASKNEPQRAVYSLDHPENGLEAGSYLEARPSTTNMQRAAWSPAMEAVDDLRESAGKHLDKIASGDKSAQRLNWLAQRIRNVAQNRDLDKRAAMGQLEPADQAVSSALKSSDTVKAAIETKDPQAIWQAVEQLKSDLGNVFAETDKIYGAGADVTRPENLPPDVPTSVQPASPPGRLVAAGRQNIDQLFGLSRNIQYLVDPMSTGSNRAMAIAKDAVSMVRRIQWDHMRADAELTRDFKMEQLTRMWNALDEESVLRQEFASSQGLANAIGAKTADNPEITTAWANVSQHMGLATLSAEERAAVERLMVPSQAAWLHAQDVGLVEADGLPAYAPRMMLNVALGADKISPRALNELGRNVFTRTAQMKHRNYLMAEETEAAAKRLVAKQMAERGASVKEIEAAVAEVQIARNIRTLPLATRRLEEATVWREMINHIEEIGKASGSDTVAVGYKPDNSWFTIAGNPAFTKWAPDLVQDPVTKKWSARVDQNGNTVFVPKPIYMSGEFRGPMKAILDESASQNKVVQGAQSLYGALMAIKGKSMTAILNSPLIHNEVVWSKVAEAAGFREWLGIGLYFRGNRIVNGIKEFEGKGRAGELIERGLNPIGPRGSYQDISAMMEEPDIMRGYHESWTGKVLGLVPSLFDEGAGKAVERAIAKAGNFTHNTLLWDRVRDVQFGLADHLSDKLVAEGADRLTADRIAAHFSNIIVGSIPKEAMSSAARATANMLLFSRSFTLGNLSTFKQAAFGLPKPILAQIERDHGISIETALGEEHPTGFKVDEMLPSGALKQVSKTAQSIARRKALSTIMLSAGLYYIGNALIQHGFNIAKSNQTWGGALDDEVRGYARRYADLMKDAQKDPFELRHLLGRLSPTYDNEPQKQDRAYVGNDKDGTAIYARNPTGKFGEEMVGYPTQPMSMVRRKLSPLASGVLDVLENDKGFGRKIYDENDRTISGDVRTAFSVAKHLVMKHLPEGQINAAVDLLHGDGDQKVNALRVFAPMAGFTVSEGAPGGQARGEQLAAKQAFDARFNIAWPDIRKQVQRGDIDGARKAMATLGVPPRMQAGLIRNAQNPAGALRGNTLRNFYQSASPEEIERFERVR